MRGFQKMGNACRALLVALMLLMLPSCTNMAVGEDVIREDCPYTLSEQAEWNDYPQDNIFGLAAIAYDRGPEMTTIVMAFANKDSAKDIDQNIIKNSDYVVGDCKYGRFEFGENEYELIQKKHAFYVRLTYDSRIQLRGVSFDKGDERDVIQVSDQVSLTYCDFRDPKESAWASQDYVVENGAWSERADRSEKKQLEASVGPTIYTKKEIVRMEDGLPPVEERDGVSLCAYGYQFHNPTYNIYGEVVEEQQAIIQFWIEGEAGTEAFRALDHPTLYLKRDGRYEDITPSDLEVSIETQDENCIKAYVSTRLIELEEGDYRLEISGYEVSFRIENQTFTVW